MRFAIVFPFCLSFAVTSLCDAKEISQTRDLPALKMRATELDAILAKTHSLVSAANGAGESGRETVTVRLDGYEIEVPHMSLASSVAFPNRIFGFSYVYKQADKPISSVTIDLGDSYRRMSVSGESADQVQALSKFVEKEFRRYARPAGGVKFRGVAGVCLLVLFLSSLMIGSAYCWTSRNYTMIGMPLCSAIGLLLVLVLPWNRFLPGFVLYQRYSPFFLVRHAPEICVLAVVTILAGIPLSYFLAQRRGKAR